MQPLVAAFWGACFGTAALMFAGAAAAWLRGLRRVALLGASAALIYTAFASSYLGLFAFPSEAVRLRVDAMVFMAAAVPLGQLVLAMIGHMRDPGAARRWRTGLYCYAMFAVGIAFLLPPLEGFVLCTAAGFGIGLVALALSIRRALRGDRLAGVAIVGVTSICVSAAALTAVALDPSAPTGVHAVAAVAGVAYLCVIAIVLWLRFSYLFELQQVVQHGAAYDPITRMRTHSETGQMVGLAFFNQKQQNARVGVVAVTIGNLLSLEKFHGRAALNHGLFVAAGRLRRSLPGGVDAGRIGEDGFLVLVRDVGDARKLVEIGHEVVQRLSRPVALSTSADPGELESGQAHWVAQVGVGILVAGAADRPSAAVAKARAMSRAAWGFPSRVAWEDGSGHVAEAPQLAPA